MVNSAELHEYYNAVYMGEQVSADLFPTLAARAEDILQLVTFGRLYAQTAYKDDVQKALCAQIEYLYLNGAETAVNGANSGSWTVGHVTVNGANSGTTGLNKMGVCAKAQALLYRTGLLYRGCGVI